MVIADTLSRAPLKSTHTSTMEDDVEVMIHTIVSNLPISSRKLEELKQATHNDPVLQIVQKYIDEGWPEHRKEIPMDIRQFWEVRNDLHNVEKILMKDNKLVIPLSMRPYILELLHKAHLGIEKTQARARNVMYWPGMSANIETLVRLEWKVVCCCH